MLYSSDVLEQIVSLADKAATHFADFDKLRMHVRLYRANHPMTCSDTTLIITAYADCADNASYLIQKNLTFKGSSVDYFLRKSSEEIFANLDTSILIQVAPRLSLIIKDIQNVGDVEIQFLNVSTSAVMNLVAAKEPDASKTFIPGFPGIECIVLFKPVGYKYSSMGDDTLIAANKQQVFTKETLANAHEALYDCFNNLQKQDVPDTPVNNTKTTSEPTQDIQNLVKSAVDVMTESLMHRSAKYSEEQSAALKVDDDGKLTPKLPHDQEYDAALEVKKLIMERNDERSPFSEGDNELQKKISKNELTDDSLNRPEILEDTEIAIPVEEANESNLDELFAQDEEEIPAPEQNNVIEPVQLVKKTNKK